MLPSILTLARTYSAAPALQGDPEKPLYLRWWFVAVFVVCSLALIASFLPTRSEGSAPPTAEREGPEEAAPARAILDPAVSAEVEGSLAG